MKRLEVLLGIEVVVFTPATQQTPDGASAISAGHQSIYPPIHQSKLLVHPCPSVFICG
jgi:hypothetical protein